MSTVNSRKAASKKIPRAKRADVRPRVSTLATGRVQRLTPGEAGFQVALLGEAVRHWQIAATHIHRLFGLPSVGYLDLVLAHRVRELAVRMDVDLAELHRVALLARGEVDGWTAADLGLSHVAAEEAARSMQGHERRNRPPLDLTNEALVNVAAFVVELQGLLQRVLAFRNAGGEFSDGAGDLHDVLDDVASNIGLQWLPSLLAGQRDEATAELTRLLVTPAATPPTACITVAKTKMVAPTPTRC